VNVGKEGGRDGEREERGGKMKGGKRMERTKTGKESEG
jgi:hypothetical protein